MFMQLKTMIFFSNFRSLKRLHLLYEQEESGKQEKVFPNSDKTVNETKYTIPLDLQNRLVEDVGLYSVFSDDTSTKGPSIKLARDTKRLFRYVVSSCITYVLYLYLI